MDCNRGAASQPSLIPGGRDVQPHAGADAPATVWTPISSLRLLGSIKLCGLAAHIGHFSAEQPIAHHMRR